MHQLVDIMVPDALARAQAHANVETLSDADLRNELERMETLRLLFEEQTEAYSAQRHGSHP